MPQSVDIGVHQDGLVHISQLADVYVKDPSDVVKAGQILKVTVMEVDVARKRIALSAKTGAKPEQSSNNSKDKYDKKAQPKKNYSKNNNRQSNQKSNQISNSPFGSLADAFKKAKKKEY